MLESILGLCHTIQAQNFKMEKKIGQLEVDVDEMKSGNPKLPEAPRTCECADMLALVHSQLEATNDKVDTIIHNVNGVKSLSPKLVEAPTKNESTCKCTEVESSLALVHSQLDSTNTKVDNFINKINDNKVFKFMNTLLVPRKPEARNIDGTSPEAPTTVEVPLE